MPLQAESPKCVEQPGGVLQVDVVARGACLTVAALQEEDFLGDARRDGGGEPALACGDAREVSNVCPADGHHAANAVPDHLRGQFPHGGDVRSGRAVGQAGEEWRAVRATRGGHGLLGTEGGDHESVQEEPAEQLVDEVEGRVKGPADGRVVTLTLDVILAPVDVDSGGAFKAGDPVAGVKVEPDIADLQGREFGDAEAAMVARATMRRSRLSRRLAGRSRSRRATRLW